MKPLICFFGLAYLISWLIWLPLYGAALGLPALSALPLQHALGGLGPLLASFITTAIYYRGNGLRQLWGRCFRFRPLAYTGIALLSPFLLAVIAATGNSILNGTGYSFTGLFMTAAFPGMNPFIFFMYNLFFFGFGEETGWRGFALPVLQTRTSALPAAAILTVFWALWHWPLFLYRPGYVTMGVAGITGWLFSLLTGSVLLTWLFNSSKGSILICAIFHATIDIAFTGGTKQVQTTNYMGMLITVWGLLTIFVYGTRNLSHRMRLQATPSNSRKT